MPRRMMLGGQPHVLNGTGGGMELGEVAVEPMEPGEESRYQRLMGVHHYLGLHRRSARCCGTPRACAASGWRWPVSRRRR